MAILLQRVALQTLSDLVQASVEPVLSAAELTRLLRYAQVADEDGNAPDTYETWAASTAYGINERVVPQPRNGYVYKVTTSGTSGLTQPTFPAAIGQTVTDGGVTWTCEAEAGWVPSYDSYWLNKSAAEGWEMKAAKISDEDHFTADGGSFAPELRREQMKAKAKTYRNRLVGSVRVASMDVTLPSRLLI
jgi:hypothetical protein